MIGERIKKVREEKGYTLKEFSKMIGKSSSAISRIENQKVDRIEPEILNNIADALGLSIVFLMRSRDKLHQNIHRIEELKPGEALEILVQDDDMSPEIPEDSVVLVRPLNPKEKLQAGSFYLIEFNNQKKFRMVIDDAENGLGFLPMEMNERRIGYDKEYVKILGKVTEMLVVFEDVIDYK